jgi:hypothetical protein
LIAPHLRLHPGQEFFTIAQEVEARRFAAERIEAQLSTAPVDELEAERLLRQAYAVAGISPPEHIRWVDGPLELLAGVLPSTLEGSAIDTLDDVWANLRARVQASIGEDVKGSLLNSIEHRITTNIPIGIWGRLSYSIAASMEESVLDRVGESIEVCVDDWVEASLRASLKASVLDGIEARLREKHYNRMVDGIRDLTIGSVNAYYVAHRLACTHFLDIYLAPNDLHALAHFNALVSGYWLGSDGAVLVRRPHVLACDQEGHLHSAAGRCVEYPDGWGFYAWHGVRVPEKVILAPEQLNRQDFLAAANLEVRRVIQERLGQRFVPELGGVVLDSGPRGTLYEVRLPEDDPERVARYVQVQDASTERTYFLRVPPTIQTAAEAVAWSFQLSVWEYDPARET